jgi:hypothetical protein
LLKLLEPGAPELTGNPFYAFSDMRVVILVNKWTAESVWLSLPWHSPLSLSNFYSIFYI